jgi:hypothetical protein
MAGYRTLGRLLWTGLLAGGVIGATVGTLLVDAAAYVPLGLLGGAGAGMVAGVVTQGLAFTVLLAVRRAWRALPARSFPLVLATVPVPMAGGLAWWLASISDSGLARRLAVTGVALGLAIGAVRLAASWCLAPLTGGQEATRR